MADAKATFALGLETAGLVKPGDDAAGVLERLRQKIQADITSLAAMNTAMRNLKGGSAVNIAAFRELTERLTLQKQAVASAQADYVNLGGKLTDLGKKLTGGRTSMAALSEAAGKTGGPLGRALQSVSGLGEKLGSLRLFALAGAAAVVALGVAVAYAIGKFVAFGIASANAARSELLHLQGLTTVRNWFGLAAGKATDLQDAISGVSASSALGRDKIAGYAEQLYRMNLRGQNLNDALEATAIKASVQGEEYANLFMGAAAGANMAGQSVKRLSDDVRARLGGIAKAQALDLNVQIAKLHESFAELFSGVKIEGFLSGLKEITGLLSQETYTGRELKRLIEILFNPLGSQVETLGPIVKRFFQGMIIGTQEVIIAVLRVRNWFRDSFGDKGLFKGLDWMNIALTTGKIAAYSMLLAFGLLAAAIGGIVGIFEPFFKLFQLAYDFVADTDWGKLGGSIIGGLDKALAKGQGLLNLRMSEIAKSLKDEFTTPLAIRSDSRVFAGYGRNIAGGLAGGVERGTPAVRRSIGDMVSAGVDAANDGGASRAAAGGSSTVVQIREVNYYSSGREQHRADAEDFSAQLANELERVKIQMGVPA